MNYRTELAHLNYLSLTDLQFRIKIIFTKSISGVGLKLVKMKNRIIKSGHDCYINMHCTFSHVFSPGIFNPPDLLNTALDDVKISNKLTSVSPIFPLFKPKYN